MSTRTDLFRTIKQIVFPPRVTNEALGLARLRTISMGSGNKTFRANEEGMFLGAERFADAPFSVDMEGNLIAASATLTSASIDGDLTIQNGHFIEIQKGGDINLISASINFNTSNINWYDDLGDHITSMNMFYEEIDGFPTEHRLYIGSEYNYSGSGSLYIYSGGTAGAIAAYSNSILATSRVSIYAGSVSGGQFYFFPTYASFNKPLKIDTINELTSAAGITIDGVLLKDNQVNASAGAKLDDIFERTAGHGVDIDGVHVQDGYVRATSQKSEIGILGDGVDNIRENIVIQAISGTQGSFNVNHGGSSKPDHVLVQVCGGTNSATIIGTWDFDASTSTYVEIWFDSDTSFSSISIRFHLIFIWV